MKKFISRKIIQTALALTTTLSGCGTVIIENFPPINPIEGGWKVTNTINCANKNPERKDKYEVKFTAANRFFFAKSLSETYAGYNGTYSFNKEDGTIKMDITDGNYIPSDTDLEGRVTFGDKNDLYPNSARLEGIYFGTFEGKDGNTSPDICGYVIERGILEHLK